MQYLKWRRRIPNCGKRKSSRRTNHEGEMEPKAVQIAGADPQMLAECAKFNVDKGAQIIDINMGCPVKKCAMLGAVPPYCKMKISRADSRCGGCCSRCACDF